MSGSSRPSSYTIRRAIRILAEAAASDGQVLMAASRLKMYPTKASALAVRAFYADRVQRLRLWQRQACATAEALMRKGWTP